MLCWVYHEDQEGPLFYYLRKGVRLWVNHSGSFKARFNKRDHSRVAVLRNTPRYGGWKFVGASYDGGSGEAKLWVNGDVAVTKNIGAGLDLATHGSIRMGGVGSDGTHFKGRMAHMQVYNKALSQEQVQLIHQKTQAVEVRMPFMAILFINIRTLILYPT